MFITVLPEADVWGSLLALSQVLLVYGAYRELGSRSVEGRLGPDGAPGDHQDKDPPTVDSMLDEAVGAIRALAEMGAGSLSPEQADSLTKPAGALTAQEKESLSLDSLSESLFRGFFHAASRGQTFADPSSIASHFGRTLEANYPEAGPAFLNFAYTYWTLKLLHDDLVDHHQGSLALNLLTKLLLLELAPIFFLLMAKTSLPSNVNQGKGNCLARCPLSTSRLSSVAIPSSFENGQGRVQDKGW